MHTTTEQRVIRVALVGNPNTGKSTLFNALCGMRQRVGNYPGVTVEKKTGRCEIGGQRFDVIDLPGSYSLAPRSPDEMIAVEVLLGLRDDVERPDVVVCIVDASNLDRNLYLLNQVLELNLPTVLAMNMADVARNKGVTVDARRLSERLGIPVVSLQANRKIGVAELRTAIVESARGTARQHATPFPQEFESEVSRLAARAADGEISKNGKSGTALPRYLVERLLLDTSGFLSSYGLQGVNTELKDEIHAARERLRAAGMQVPAIEAVSRYQWVGDVLDGVVTRTPTGKILLSDRLDRVLTHRVWGTLVFLVVMLTMFEAVFAAGDWASQWIDAAFGVATDFVLLHVAEGALRSLVIDGVIAGVGGVVVFLPQIFVLFLFVGILEDCGYMTRAAYLMDKLMARIGLSGKSFIPLLSSFACAIPGIMSARVIENPRDRLLTILVAPLMSCSARLPVYTLLIQAFIPDLRWSRGLPGLQALVMFSMFLVGIVAAVLVTFILRRTLFRGPTPPFVMELPTFKMPSLRLVLYRMFESGWMFVRRAGTLILAVSVLVWAAAYYPRGDSDELRAMHVQRDRIELLLDDSEQNPTRMLAGEKVRIEQQRVALDNQLQSAYLRQSYLGRVGGLIEPAVRPLGWDWRIGCAAIASFPAREVVIATLGVIFNLGSGQDESSDELRETLQAATWEGTSTPLFSVPVALSLMVFFALCAQCLSTLVVMRRETNSWRWPVFTFIYMTTIAYFGAMFTYQVFRLFV